MSRDDLNAVLNEGITLALELLRNRGEFYPFAIVLTESGELRHVHVGGENDRPSVVSVGDTLRCGLRSIYATAARAVGVFSNTTVTDRVTALRFDAVKAELESRDLEAVTCYAQYTVADSKAAISKIHAEGGRLHVFGVNDD